MFEMTVGRDPMMLMSKWNMSMNNVSSTIIQMMTKEIKEYMDKMLKENMNSENKLSSFNMHILDVMTRGIKSHQDKYLKVKAMQCNGATQAFSCIVNNLQRSSGLHSDAVAFVASVGSHLYVVVSDMCVKERSCDLAEGELLYLVLMFFCLAQKCWQLLCWWYEQNNMYLYLHEEMIDASE